MRRIPVLLSLVLVLAFILASCAPADEGTDVPGVGTDMPGVTETVDLTAMPGTTEPSLTEPAVTATEPVMTEPVGTPIVATTEPAATETVVATETEVLPPTGMLDANRLSVLMDFKVVTQDGEQVGDVDNFIINLTNTKIDYVIVDSATFLDIGGRKIAVPWESVEIQADDDDNVAEDENVFVLAFGREEFENAPDFDPDAFPAIGDEIPDWDLYLTSYWDTAGTGAAGAAAGQATTTPATEAVATDTPEAAQATDEAGQPSEGRVRGVILASDLLGMQLVGDDGESMGEIQDAIVNLNNGKIKYLVVQIDTADGSETRLLAIPVLVLRWDADGQAFGFTVDRPTLDAAPFFENEEWPDTGISGWDDQILAYWRDLVDGLDDD